MIRHSSHRLFDDEPESARNGYDPPRARRSSPGDSTGAVPVPVWEPWASLRERPVLTVPAVLQLDDPAAGGGAGDQVTPLPPEVIGAPSPGRLRGGALTWVVPWQ